MSTIEEKLCKYADSVERICSTLRRFGPIEIDIKSDLDFVVDNQMLVYAYIEQKGSDEKAKQFLTRLVGLITQVNNRRERIEKLADWMSDPNNENQPLPQSLRPDVSELESLEIKHEWFVNTLRVWAGKSETLQAGDLDWKHRYVKTSHIVEAVPWERTKVVSVLNDAGAKKITAGGSAGVSWLLGDVCKAMEQHMRDKNLPKDELQRSVESLKSLGRP